MPLGASPNIAVVGATGAVGRELLALLQERRFPRGELRLLASARSAGMTIAVADTGGTRQELTVRELTEAELDGVDLALFSAGGSTSRRYAPPAAARGTIVIDNSSAFRMDSGVPLVVPEINADHLDPTALAKGGIVANPNCSTIIALMAATPLHRAAGVERMVVSTYQAASGAGAATMAELEQQARDYAAGRPLTTKVIGRQYIFNIYSHDTPIDADGYNEEEAKLVRETRKIWGEPDARVTATCIRVPVLRAHCAAVNLTFRAPLDEGRAREILAQAPGVSLADDRAANRFPEPITAAGLDDVLVGRVRADLSQPPGLGLNLFVAGDQLRKGAALNAIQIAEQLLEPRPTTPSATRPTASA